MRYELFHKAFRGISVSDCTCLDANENSGSSLAVSDEHLFVEKIENKSLVAYLMEHLTEKQRKVIEAIFIHNLTLDEYRLQEGISFKVAYMHQHKPYPLSRTFLREREKQQFLPEPLLLSFY